MSEVPLETLSANVPQGAFFFLFFLTLVTGPRKSLSRKLSETAVHQIRARLETTAHFCKLVVLAAGDPSALRARFPPPSVPGRGDAHTRHAPLDVLQLSRST